MGSLHFSHDMDGFSRSRSNILECYVSFSSLQSPGASQKNQDPYSAALSLFIALDWRKKGKGRTSRVTKRRARKRNLQSYTSTTESAVRGIDSSLLKEILQALIHAFSRLTLLRCLTSSVNDPVHLIWARLLSNSCLKSGICLCEHVIQLQSALSLDPFHFAKWHAP
ncbi:hypothetical protein VNO77_44208 [Canavalia gladiata]|uniref:Uncharacterized protein n=1 Tax=Canavalia gladiata TaxID=3824 RepID=A0AAN9JXN0_CANGL